MKHKNKHNGMKNDSTGPDEETQSLSQVGNSVWTKRLQQSVTVDFVISFFVKFCGRFHSAGGCRLPAGTGSSSAGQLRLSPSQDPQRRGGSPYLASSPLRVPNTGSVAPGRDCTGRAPDTALPAGDIPADKTSRCWAELPGTKETQSPRCGGCAAGQSSPGAFSADSAWNKLTSAEHCTRVSQGGVC